MKWGVKPRCPRYRSLDLWRGIACLMIVVFHSTEFAARLNPGAPHDWAWWLSEFARRLRVGVPLFFVISGYCISATADATRLHNASTVTYFKRRFRRILPPYWATLALSAVGLGLAIRVAGIDPAASRIDGLWGPWELSLPQWIRNFSLTEIWAGQVFREPQRVFLAQAWSLCYEELFYAMVGFLLAFARRWFFPAMLGISALCATGLLLGQRYRLPDYSFFCFLLFASGVLVYYQVNYCARRGTLVSVGLLVAALAVAARRPSALVETSANQPQFAVASFSFALLLIGIHDFDSRLASASWLWPFHRCGALCYSLYLVHWPIVVLLVRGFYAAGFRDLRSTLLVTAPVCMAISLGVAWAFHVAVERRFLNQPLATARPPAGGPRPRVGAFPWRWWRAWAAERRAAL